MTSQTGALPMNPGDIDIFKQNLFTMLRKQGLIIVGGIATMLAAWVIAANALRLDVTFASRSALLGSAPILLFGIFYPLLTSHQDKRRIFIVSWFLVATFFNVVWEMPQVLFIDLFHEANQNISLEKLPYFIAWWGYTTSDLDYFNTTRYFILAEVSFWIINLLSFVGIYHILRGHELKAMLWFGACATMQIYNVICIFIPHGIIVEQGRNIARDSVLADAAFWIMNLMWVLASSAVLFLAYRRVFELYKSRNNT
jgi:hypothetical protein